MTIECLCGSQAFAFHYGKKTARCLKCKLGWELDEQGDLKAPMLPSVNQEPLIPEPKPISAIDIFMAEMYE